MLEQLETPLPQDAAAQKLNEIIEDLSAKQDKLSVPAYVFVATALLILFSVVQLAEGVTPEQELLMRGICQFALFMLAANATYLGYLAVNGQLPDMAVEYNVFSPTGKTQIIIDEKVLLTTYSSLIDIYKDSEYVYVAKRAWLAILSASPKVRAEVIECMLREMPRLTRGSDHNKWNAMINVLCEKSELLDRQSKSREKIQEFAQLVKQIAVSSAMHEV